MREGQVPLAGPGTRKEGQGETERKRGRERKREKVLAVYSERSFLGCLECGVAHGWTRAGPTGRTPGVGASNWTQLDRWEKKGPRGEGGSHKYGTGKTKCELGVSIGNSAFTFLLHFYFKHRKRQRKQEIKLLSFLFWQHAPFSFLSSLLVPQPRT